MRWGAREWNRRVEEMLLAYSFFTSQSSSHFYSYLQPLRQLAETESQLKEDVHTEVRVLYCTTLHSYPISAFFMKSHEGQNWGRRQNKIHRPKTTVPFSMLSYYGIPFHLICVKITDTKVSHRPQFWPSGKIILCHLINISVYHWW